MSTAVQETHGIAPHDIPEDLLAGARPLAIRGLAANWPSVAAGRDGPVALLDYLRRFSRNHAVLAFRGEPAMQGRFFYNEDLSGFNFERITSTIDGIMEQLRPPADRDTPHLYIGSTPVEDCLPGFRAENDLSVGATHPLVSIWMGNRSRIAAHFDAPSNMACVVAGRRRFTLFPPEQLANLYVGPLDFTPAGQAISLVDFKAPDLARFPRFEAALQASMTVELGPGDALYVPSMWWHHVEATDPLNVLINYWWNPPCVPRGNPLNVLIHALLGIKGLPATQREAWRGLFDYYVFSDQAELSHIPPQRRGVLGELDPGLVRQLRAMLRNRLRSSS